MSREREKLEEIGKKLKRESSDAFTTQYYHHMGGGSRKHMLWPPGTLNTITPCAACKLLRRRCAQECPFSPYFSPHEPQKFASVHKVFGASNVSKMIMEVPENQRANAANSLVYEANIRLRDPVYGCMGAISALQQQVQILQAELNTVRAEISKYKYRETNLLPSSSRITLLSTGAVSVAAPPPTPPPLPPPPPLLPPPPSLPLTPSSFTSSAADFSTNENNITYFG